MNYHFFKLLAQVKVFVVKLHKMVNLDITFLFSIEIKVWMTIILHQRFVLVIDNLELNLTISHFGKLHALFDEIDSPFLETYHSCFWIVNFFDNNFSSAHLFITLGIIQLYL